MMSGKFHLFRNKLAKRFFAMFVACALVPIIGLTIVCYRGVTKQLTDQSFNRLRQSAKSHGLSIYENLVLADNQLDILHTLLAHRKGVSLSSLSPVVKDRNSEIFAGIALFGPNKLFTAWGKEVSAIGRDKIVSMDLAKGEGTLTWVNNGNEWPEVVVVRRAETSDHPKVFLVGVVKSSFLWGFDQGSSLPPASEFSVRDDRGNYLFSTLGHTMDANQNPGKDEKDRKDIAIDGKRYHASSWSMFMKPKFHIPAWAVTVMEPRDYVLEPMNYFSKVFPPIILLSFVIVIWLSNGAIRRSLIPIDSLMQGARRVADRHFDHRVIVESKDEFHDLADAFNRMTDELDIQFKVLAARSDLDRAILSVLDMEQIITTSLNQSSELFPFRTVSISILDADNPMDGRSFIREEKAPNSHPKVVPFGLSNDEHRALRETNTWLHVKADASIPSYLGALQGPDFQDFVVLPILIHDRLFGIVSLGTKGEIAHSQQDLEQIRAFCDHLAVAFSNSNLIKELKDLNMGALQALALTVDAKSPWTAGHSIRVANMAIRIGIALGFPPDRIDALERAALLHDIGKIAIRHSILDKDGKLTAEEYDLIKEHPSRGARILSPVRAYAGIIPIVEQHHERYDGKGYPYGLRADQIHPSARILAVADSFDAMVSDRPYRKALGRQRASEIVREEAGSQFDPTVVEAFKLVVEGAEYDAYPPSLTDNDLLSSHELRFEPFLGELLGIPGKQREIEP
jgi:putative nucleotidyltransferase with HDIG domain